MTGGRYVIPPGPLIGGSDRPGFCSDAGAVGAGAAVLGGEAGGAVALPSPVWSSNPLGSIPPNGSFSQYAYRVPCRVERERECSDRGKHPHTPDLWR